MSRTYEYDENGVTFSYFTATILAFILLPMTFNYLRPKSKVKKAPEDCNCPPCTEKRKHLTAVQKKNSPIISKRLIFFIVGWAMLIWSAYTIWFGKLETAAYDPYMILGIDHGSDESVIKKAFRKLTMRWHPDKATEEDKPFAEETFVRISKAYQALTDPEIRENWEKYGNPDGQQSFSLGIALPKWIVDANHSAKVLALYALVFGVLMPYLVSKWWTRSKKYTKDNLNHQTMALYYEHLKEHMPIKKILEILSASMEFKEEIPWKLSDDTEVPTFINFLSAEVEIRYGDKLEKSKTYNAPYCLKSSALLNAHLYRVPVSNSSLKEDQGKIVEKAIKLVLGMLQIAIMKEWLDTAGNCMMLCQMLVQAVPDPDNELLQLPYLNNDILKHFKTKKKRNIKTIKQFLLLPDEDQQMLTKTLEGNALKEILTIANKIPQIRISKTTFRVLGEESITPESIVTLVVKLSLLSEEEEKEQMGSDESLDFDDVTTKLRAADDEVVDDDDGRKGIAPKEPITNPNDPIHAPYYPVEKRPFWWVYLGIPSKNAFITLPVKVYDLVKTKNVKMQFQAPPMPGTYTYQLFVKSDSFVGGDLWKELKLQVVAAPKEVIEEEDISDSEPSFREKMMEALQSATAEGAGLS